ncbi:hypothetical protein [Martelella sp. FOR1707]
MICDIDGIRLIGLHRADAAGMPVRCFAAMRSGAVVIPLPAPGRGGGTVRGICEVVHLADIRRQGNKMIEVRQCISQ